MKLKGKQNSTECMCSDPAGSDQYSLESLTWAVSEDLAKMCDVTKQRGWKKGKQWGSGGQAGGREYSSHHPQQGINQITPVTKNQEMLRDHVIEDMEHIPEKMGGRVENCCLWGVEIRNGER